MAGKQREMEQEELASWLATMVAGTISRQRRDIIGAIDRLLADLDELGRAPYLGGAAKRALEKERLRYQTVRELLVNA